MAIRTRTLIATILIILLIAGGLWWLSSRRGPGPSKATMDQLRQSGFRFDYDKKQKAAAELAKMGDDTIPSLAAALKAKDNALDAQFDKWRHKLPPDLQKLFRIVLRKMSFAGPLPVQSTPLVRAHHEHS